MAGCAKGGTDRAAGPADDLRPAFPAVATSSSVAPGAVADERAGGRAGGGDATAAAAASDAAPREAVPGTAAPTGASDPAAPVSATIDDPTGDATPSVLDPAPRWSDLAGATLTRNAKGFELRVRLAGGEAPTTTDAEHTMNIASFYDVDGDGTIDYEVWANLAAGGWGGSWFDNRNGTGRFGDDAGVTWTPEGDELVMRFPLGHVAGATSFRWSVASEWGRYEVLSTPASVRDDAPDADRPAGFGGGGVSG